jgi:hypothetical protein
MFIGEKSSFWPEIKKAPGQFAPKGFGNEQ